MKYLYSTIGIVVGIIVAYSIFSNASINDETSFSDNSSAHIKTTQSEYNNTSSSPKINSIRTYSQIDKKELEINPTFTQQDIAEVIQDRNADFLMHRDSHPYIHYDKDTLRSLAESGDTIAMKELSVRLTEEANFIHAMLSDNINLPMTEELKKNEEAIGLYKEAEDYEKMAVYHGDKEILTFAKDAFIKEFKSHDLSPKDELLLKLSYDIFVGIRGNKLAMLGEIEKSIFIHESVYGPVSLSPEDKDKIHNQASEIYEEIESQRIKLGLGPFDNTPRDYEIKQYSSNLEEHREALGENVFIN